MLLITSGWERSKSFIVIIIFNRIQYLNSIRPARMRVCGEKIISRSRNTYTLRTWVRLSVVIIRAGILIFGLEIISVFAQYFGKKMRVFRKAALRDEVRESS